MVLGAINKFIGGEFLFFMPQVWFGASLLAGPNPWNLATHEWLAYADWLAFPLVTFLGSLIYVILRMYRSFGRRLGDNTLFSVERNAYMLFFSLQYMLMCMVFVTWQLLGTPVLLYQYLASYLIPGMFLANGSLLAIILSHLNRARFPWLWLASLQFCLQHLFPALGLRFTPCLQGSMISDQCCGRWH